MVNPVYLALVYFLISVPSLLVNYHADDEAQDLAQSNLKSDYIQNKTETFDFIIIGGGSAGAVIANRLSKQTGNSVLLLERGSTPSILSAFPYLWVYLARTDPGAWSRYTTTPQPGFALSSNSIVTLISGKVLGGGSTINAMIYTRGNPKIYDTWADLTGDKSWTYENVLPFFKKFEDYHGVFSNPLDEKYHSVGGELHVESPNLIQPSASIFLNAVQERNLKIKDLNAEQTAGFQPIDYTMKEGRRWSTYKAFLEPILTRRNLNIYTYSTATKIHLDSKKKAYGVTYTRHGQTRYVEARKEIIVCAGAFESPKLLMLSGIGPKEDLEALGIQSQVDLPVGKNFQDHISASVLVRLNDPIAFVPERDLTASVEAQYLTQGTGPLHNTIDSLGYITSTENNDPSFPDLQFFISHQVDPGTDPVLAATVIRNDTNTLSVFLVRPNSGRGQIKLNSAVPTDKLIVNPNYATDPSDARRLGEGLKWVVDVYENSNSFAKAGGAQLVDYYFPPACTSLGARSDAYWECIARVFGTTGWHVTGTCSMGKNKHDPKAVVDSELRVLGTTNLRVADASVMPLVPNANTNVPSIMVGERASYLIQKRWGLLSLIEWPFWGRK